MDLTPYKNCKAHKQWLFISNDEKPYRPCCYFKTNIDATTVDEYYDQLSKMDIETNCKYCIDLEKNGNPFSQRKEAEDTIRDDELRITVSFDNLCNLRCTYCSPRYSTQIANESKNSQKLYRIISEQGPSKLEFIKTALKQNTYPYININILGGEPLINPLIFEFLDWLSEQPYASTTAISMLTNGTMYKPKLQEYSRIFRFVGLGFSIDGTDDIFEYIRSNGKWAEVKDNIDRYYQLQDHRFKINFQYALTWMNALWFADWYNWIYTSYPNLDSVHMNKLVYPEEQSVDVIPLKSKQIILKRVFDNILPTNDPKFLEIQDKFKTQLMTGEDKSELFPLAQKLFTAIDQTRNTNHEKVLTEIIKLI